MKEVMFMIFKTKNKTVYPIIFETDYEGLNSINCYVYYDGKSYTLIDAGIENRDYETYFEDALASYGIKLSDISQVLLTHFHLDHIGLLNFLQSKGDIIVYASSLAIPRILLDQSYLTKKVEIYEEIYRQYGVLQYAKKRLQKLQATANTASEKTWKIYPIQEGDMITDLQVISTPGHSPDSVSFYDTTTGWLFGGDVIFNSGIASALIEYDEHDQIVSAFAQYADSLDKLESLFISIVFPGHDRPFSNIKEIIEKAKSKIDYKFNKLIDLIKQGENTAEKLGIAIYGKRFEPLFTYTISEIIGLLQFAEQQQVVEKKVIDGVYVFSVK